MSVSARKAKPPHLEDHKYLTTLLRDLFPRRRRRRDEAPPRPMEPGEGVVVAETPDERRAVAVAALLLAQVREHGGTPLSQPALLAVAERALDTFSTEDRAPVIEEVVTALDWLADHLMRTKEGRRPTDSDDVHFDPAPRAARVEEALAEGRDVEIDYFTYHRSEWNRRRVTPARLARGFLVGRCHLRGGERRFKLTRIRSVELVDDEA